MTRFLAALFLAGPLAFVAPAPATEPLPASERAPGTLAVTGPTEVDRDKLVRLSVTDPDPKAAYLWITLQPDKIDRATTDPTLYQFAAPPGKYTVVLIKIIVKDGVPIAEQTTHTVTIGGDSGGTDPPVVEPPTDPPTTPPTGAIYFLVVRPDGPASPAFTRTMSHENWQKLQAAGHLVKDMTATRARPWFNAAGVSLPVVVTLRLSIDGKMSRIVRGPVPLPDGDAILKLPEGVK